MGCGSSHSINNGLGFQKNAVVTAIDERKIKFQKDLLYFEQIHNAFKEGMMNRVFMEDLDEVEKDKTMNINQHLHNLWEKHNGDARRAKLDKTQFNQLVLELIGENIIKTKFSYQEYDMFKLVKEKMTEILTGLTTEEKTNALGILTAKEGYYLRKQKGIVYFTDKIQSEIGPYWKAIHNNLKFNKELVINSLTIVLTPNLFSRDGIMEDVDEIIEFNSNLSTLNIFISPLDKEGNYYDSYKINPNTYKYLYRIFEAVKNNPNIKLLLFNCAKDYDIILPPEITNLIYEKIKEDTLLGFHIGNFYWSDCYMKYILEEISLSKNMTYLGMDMEVSNPANLNHLKQSLLKNKSLAAIFLSGFTCETNKNFFDEFKAQILQDKNMKFFHYEKTCSLVKSNK